MTVKLRHLSRWKQIAPGMALVLPGKQRYVELEVNVERPTSFHVEHKRQLTFVAAVEPGGPVVIKFAVDGDCTVVPTTDGEVWYFTDDGQAVNFDIRTESFTKLEQRMEMSPEMEITLLKADIRREQRAREVAELLLAKRQREEAALAGADVITGEVHEEPGAPAEGSGKSTAVSGDGGSSEPKPAGGGDLAAKPATA